MSIARGRGAVIEDVDIMDEEDLDRIEAQPLQGEFERAHDAVISVIIDFAARGDIEELADAETLRRLADLEQPADLGRNHILASGLAAQEMVEAGFGKAGAIKWCCIEIARAGLPCLGKRVRSEERRVGKRG